MSKENPLLAELEEPREILELLTPEESAQLLMLVRQAKQNQQRNLDLAIDKSLEVLPRLLRIPARKILFGK
ncbi:hypothetical protein HLB23_23225 [Nocardia uniformis]|uniref:Uncharacterized protein n=1 Tax=Nocardia uniformis TaxID=53432 RepID=A0A849CCJ2_9NOCA|nr:hypothetical protein [Nocardia uniformis]NNH72739.1 hypothetical protein [Nocardia uniformis]